MFSKAVSFGSGFTSKLLKTVAGASIVTLPTVYVAKVFKEKLDETKKKAFE